VTFAYLSMLTGRICGWNFNVAAAVARLQMVQLRRVPRLGYTLGWCVWTMVLGDKQRLRGEPLLLMRAMLGGIRWHIGVYVGHVEPACCNDLGFSNNQKSKLKIFF